MITSQNKTIHNTGKIKKGSEIVIGLQDKWTDLRLVVSCSDKLVFKLQTSYDGKKWATSGEKIIIKKTKANECVIIPLSEHLLLTNLKLIAVDGCKDCHITLCYNGR